MSIDQILVKSSLKGPLEGPLKDPLDDRLEDSPKGLLKDLPKRKFEIELAECKNT